MSVNFMKAFAHHCEVSEIPPRFAIWTALTGISAALGRRVWLPMGTFTIYPNMYVLLVAGSGRCRKSVALDQLSPFVEALDPPLNMVSQKLTAEALIDALLDGRAELVDAQTGETTIVHEAFLHADEFSHFLNAQTYEHGIGPMLTNAADGRRIEYRTKARGKELVRAPCLTILGATTVEWIRSAIPASAVGGGLTSRFLFVYEAKPPKPVAFPQRPSIDTELSQAFASIHQTAGVASMTPKACEIYESHYDRWVDSPLFLNPHLTGYASRRYVHALRLAMLLAVSETPLHPPIIDAHHVRGAELLLSDIEPGMPRVLTLITSSAKGALGETLLTYLDGTPQGLTREELLQTVAHSLSFREFLDILETLVQSGKVVRQDSPRGAVFRSAEVVRRVESLARSAP